MGGESSSLSRVSNVSNYGGSSSISRVSNVSSNCGGKVLVLVR